MDDQPLPPDLDDRRMDDCAGTALFTPREREMIAEAEASVERDGTIPWDEVHAWLLSLGTPSPLPMPLPRK